MTTPEEDIKAQLEASLTENAGVASVEVDGQKIAFDPNALDKLDQMNRRINASNGRRPRVSKIWLGGGP